MTSMTERPIPDSEIRVIKPELPSLETKPAPEKWIPNFGLLVISGPPGSGTTSLAKGLVELTDADLYTVGQTVRELSGEDDRAPIFVERDPVIDAHVDEKVRQMVIHADKSTPAIAEAQIGAITALDLQSELADRGISLEENPVIRILLTARKEIRDERVYKASRDKGELNKETGRPFTKEEIRKRNTGRAKLDIAWWKGLYPNLIGDDHPHSIGARDAQGRKIYHLEFDNSDHESPDQTLQEVLSQLREMGLISPKEHEIEPEEEVYLSGPRFTDRIKGLFSKNPDKKIAN